MDEGGEEVRNKQIIFRNHVKDFPKESDFEIKTGTISLKIPHGTKALLLKNLYLSCDRFMLGRMKELDNPFAYPCFTPGSPVDGLGVAKVLDSTHPDFEKGDLVWGFAVWEEFSLISNPEFLFKITNTDLPLSYYTGILGMHGLLAYAGFYDVCSPKKGEYVYISGASGAIGHIVGQFAKLMGCYVVGSAGSKEKVDLLKKKLGFDDAFNYNEESDLNAALKRCFPEGIDSYFDNVGGSMLDAVLLNMRTRGRIAICGLISLDNLEEPESIRNLYCLLTKKIRMEGFVFDDYFHLYPNLLQLTLDNIKEGKLVYIEDIVEGLENAPSALAGLFTWRNAGKRVVVAARE